MMGAGPILLVWVVAAVVVTGIIVASTWYRRRVLRLQAQEAEREAQPIQDRRKPSAAPAAGVVVLPRSEPHPAALEAAAALRDVGGNRRRRERGTLVDRRVEAPRAIHLP